MKYQYREPETGRFTKRNIVRNLPKNPEIQFVDVDYECEAIKKYLGEIASDYDTFFVIVGDGDYVAVWGMCGVVQYLTKFVYRIV